MKNLKQFRNDKSGIVLVGLICITFIMCSSLIGLVGALAVNKVADALTPFVSDNTEALNVVTNARNSYIIGVVLVDLSLLGYWAVSAQRKESVESPPSGVFM